MRTVRGWGDLWLKKCLSWGCRKRIRSLRSTVTVDRNSVTSNLVYRARFLGARANLVLAAVWPTTGPRS